MQLRKLTPTEIARLCACGLFPYEAGHAHSCRIWRDQEIGRLHTKVAALQARIAELSGPHTARRAIAIIPEPSGWRCAVCRGDVFARSVRDPDRCVRCAARDHVAA